MRFISAQILLAFIAICVAFVTASALPEVADLEIRQAATNASAAAASSSSSVSAAEATGSGYPGGVATGSTGGGDVGGLSSPNTAGTGTTGSTNSANGVGKSAASVNAPAWVSSIIAAGFVGLAFVV